MPLLEKGSPVSDSWAYAVEEQALGAGDIIVPLARLDEGLARGGDGKLGVALKPDEAVESLRDVLPKLSLIAVHFPIFRDGRAFSQARALREHLLFTGEIRATGHVLPDQYEFLVRCGVTTVETPDGADLAVWQRSLRQFHVAMQPSVTAEPATGFGLRRFLRNGVA